MKRQQKRLTLKPDTHTARMLYFELTEVRADASFSTRRENSARASSDIIV
jgi:hypothetical protein